MGSVGYSQFSTYSAVCFTQPDIPLTERPGEFDHGPSCDRLGLPRPALYPGPTRFSHGYPFVLYAHIFFFPAVSGNYHLCS